MKIVFKLKIRYIDMLIDRWMDGWMCEGMKQFFSSLSLRDTEHW